MIPRTGISVSKKELLCLLVVFVVYVLLGGVIFMLLESPLEEHLRKELAELRNEFQEKLSQLGAPNVTREDMERLMLRLATARSRSLIDDAGNDTHTNWSFDNSFFFAITVVTTIGYGHLAPSTTQGRLFCVLYATVGIPLTGILLAAIGGRYSKHLVRRLQRARKAHSRLFLALSAARCLLPWLLVFLVLPAALFMLTEGWSFVEGFYYCFVTLSTIGFGDYVAGNFEGSYTWLYKIWVVLWVVFGLGYLAMILNYISRMMRCKQIRKVERKLSTSFHHTQQRVGQRLEEVYQILQDVHRNRSLKPRHRVLKRMQSFPAPELKDRNHNHKIQRLLKLVQNLREEAQEVTPDARPRRLSLPLPVPNLSPGVFQARGSLQVFATNNNNSNSYRTQNGVQKKTPYLSPWVFPHDTIGVVDVVTAPIDVITGGVVDVVTAPIDVITLDRRTVVDMEGLQCTRV